jgi:hypothetical protein
MLNSAIWIEIKRKLSTVNTTDEYTQRTINKEKEHWQGISTHVIAVVQYLAEHLWNKCKSP